jgi:sodium/hydrogen antiporter
MNFLLVFASALLVAALLSELSHRSVLSSAVLFLVVGFIAGGEITGWIQIAPQDEFLSRLAELALFSVLFTDGMHAGLRELRAGWRLPGRALVAGLPLTLIFTAALAHFIAGMPWGHAFLIGAVLSPTDPVFAAALVGRAGVPRRLQHLLNVESGLNDGLALPVVVVLLAVVGDTHSDAAELATEVALGIAIGVTVPLAALRLESTRFFAASETYEPLLAFSIGLVVLALGLATHANLFLAAFAAGVTVTSVSPRFREAFHRFGESVTELLKLAALLAFGALISPTFLAEVPASGYVFAVFALFLARPVALAVSFVGTGIDRREWAAAAWFRHPACR